MRLFARSILLVMCLIVGCGKQEPSGPTPPPTQPQATDAFCPKIDNIRTAQRLGIVNGITTDSYPHVVLLRTQSGGRCTGTTLGHNTVITARHCVTSGSYLTVGSTTSITKTYSEEIDLAVVVFPHGSFPNHHATITHKRPTPDAIITLVGYGQTDYVNNNNSDGQKRVGCNKLLGFANRYSDSIVHRTDDGDFLHFRSPISTSGLTPGASAMTGRGDSGGPVFIDGQLAGVVSFGHTRESLLKKYPYSIDFYPDDTQLYEYDVNLFRWNAIELLKQARYKIGAEIPGLDALESAYLGAPK